jgi:signal transduction histidine kinase/PAS domain-containing protein
VVDQHLDRTTSVPVATRARALFDQSDMAGVYLVIRLGGTVALGISGVVLWLMWGWVGGFFVALLSLGTGADALLRLRSGEHGKLWFLMVVDITAIGIVMVASGLPDVIAIAPYTYAVTAAALLLPLVQARWLVASVVVWLAAILVIDRLPYVFELSETQALVVGAIGLAVYITSTVVLTSFAARALRTREVVQTELHEAGRRLHAVVTGAPVALLALNRDGVFTVAEGAGLRAFDVSPEALVGTHARDLFAVDYQLLGLLERGLRERDPIAEIVQYRDSVLDIRVTPIRSKSDEPDGLIGTATDVTARFRAQRELEERGDLEHLIATLSTMLMTTPLSQVDDGVVDALAEIGDFAGVERSFVMLRQATRDRWSITHEWYRDGIGPQADHYQNITIRDYPWMLDRLEQGRIVSVASASALPNEAAGLRKQMFDNHLESFSLVPLDFGGSTAGMIGFASSRPTELRHHDLMLMRIVGEMIIAVLERRRAHTRLEQLVASKDDFVASVSHELRTPLTAVVGLSEELRDRAESFSSLETGQLHEMIADQAADVAGIVEDLLVAARADLGEVSIIPTELDLMEEIDFVLAAVGRQDRARITLRRDAVAAIADRTRVRQILRNLITNALRYGGETIVVEVSRVGERVAMDVCDDGEGVDTESASKIFDPYHHTRQEVGRPPSIGLGLTVARQLARLMHGDLGYSYVDGWSRFRLELPAAMTPASAVAAATDDLGSPEAPDPPATDEASAPAPGDFEGSGVAVDQLGPEVKPSSLPSRSRAHRSS